MNDKYTCYLNGHIYGRGDLAYMLELFGNYFVTQKMHGRKESEFRVVKDGERV